MRVCVCLLLLSQVRQFTFVSMLMHAANFSFSVPKMLPLRSDLLTASPLQSASKLIVAQHVTCSSITSRFSPACFITIETARLSSSLYDQEKYIFLTNSQQQQFCNSPRFAVVCSFIPLHYGFITNLLSKSQRMNLTVHRSV